MRVVVGSTSTHNGRLNPTMISNLIPSQKILEPGATIVPVILASDKTHLSQFSGDKQAWPVYLTIGNINQSIRRKPSERATVLVGYIPITHGECFSMAKQKFKGYQLFHDLMRAILKPLVEAGKYGVRMTCADRRI